MLALAVLELSVHQAGVELRDPPASASASASSGVSEDSYSVLICIK
jgi:hypothetical protein